MDESYVQGFVEKCAELGVDAEVLVKASATNYTDFMMPGQPVRPPSLFMPKAERESAMALQNMPSGVGRRAFRRGRKLSRLENELDSGQPYLPPWDVLEGASGRDIRNARRGRMMDWLKQRVGNAREEFGMSRLPADEFDYSK